MPLAVSAAQEAAGRARSGEIPDAVLPHGFSVLDVIAATRVSPHMQRITFAGDAIAQMAAGPNIKLFIPARGAPDVVLPEAGVRGRPHWPNAATRPVPRTYSVRRIDRDRCLLDIDFVLHGHDGPASGWAAHVQPGARLLVAGPGGRMVRPASRYVLAGDMSALPAIGHILETLPGDAKGVAFIETAHAQDRIAPAHPSGISIEWLDAPEGASALPDAVRSHFLASGAQQDVFLWVGGESDAVRAIRAYGRDELALDRRMILAVGYWRRGMSEDAYHHAYDNDRDADYHQVWREERMKGGQDNG